VVLPGGLGVTNAPLQPCAKLMNLRNFKT
jgi:hypothetical protein